MRRELAIASLVLAAAIAAAFAPLFTAGITNWDDGVYLQAASAPMATVLRAPVLGNFHPLTMASLAIEERLFGVDARELHGANVLLHACASLCVLLLLVELTGSPLAALGGALFFAVHPLRVESVGWIAERKDVLCELFFAAALVAYLRHLRRGTSFGWTFALFLLAVLAKATAVVFPLAMLLIAYLERRRPRTSHLIATFAASAVFGVIAYLAQRGPGAREVLPGFAFSPLEKALLACRALVMYIGREIVPANLSAFYDYPKSVTAVDALCGAGVVVLIVAVAAAATRWRPLFFGFAFFLVVVAPTLPLLSIGATIAADRYTLLPSIGLAYLVALGLASMRRLAATFAIVLGAALLAALTWHRCAVWHDSLSLWSSVIDADDHVALAYNNRAAAWMAAGQPAPARSDLDRALALDGCYADARHNRAVWFARAGDFAAADRDLVAAIACNPRDEQARRMRAELAQRMRPH